MEKQRENGAPIYRLKCEGHRITLLDMKGLTPEEKKAFQRAGRIGGKKRFAGTTAEERTDLARKLAQARWKKARKSKKN